MLSAPHQPLETDISNNEELTTGSRATEHTVHNRLFQDGKIILGWVSEAAIKLNLQLQWPVF
jgi:hypothetical protein